jgi:hypothetical protein
MKSKLILLDACSQKYEVFNIFTGSVDDQNQVVEGDRAGVAFLKGKSKIFTVRLWMFDSSKYFIAPHANDSTKYDLLSLEEYMSRDGEQRSQWHKVGQGKYFGNYIRLNFFLLNRDLYLSLFPNQKEPAEAAV